MTQDIIRQLPNCVVLSTVSQDEDEQEWLRVRNTGIGGSDIGAICGVSPFSSARQIYLAKTGQFADTVSPSATAQERMRFGHLLEPIVASEFERRYNADHAEDARIKVVNIDCTLVHKDYAWARANVDRLIVDATGKVVGILECKTTGEYNNEEWESGEILLSYMYQLQWYMWICGLSYGAFACLVGGNKFYYYEVFYNDELVTSTLFPAAQNFWINNVRALVEPEMQATDTELAAGLYSEVAKGSEITLEGDVNNELARVVVECKAQIKELTATMEEAQNRLKDRLQSVEIGYTQDYVIKWSPRTQRRVDSDILKKEFPNVYEKCLRTISFRAMSVRGAKV